MKKRALTLFWAVWMICALTGCGEKRPAEPETQVTPPPVEEPEEAPGKEPEPYVPSGINPLTGEPMEPEYENNRPVAVMLNNLKAAQPQLGVSRADIIYEVSAEGGITRMLALYLEPEGLGLIGSVRSARQYYWEIAQGHDAVFIHAGGSPEFYNTKSSKGLFTIQAAACQAASQKSTASTRREVEC